MVWNETRVICKSLSCQQGKLHEQVYFHFTLFCLFSLRLVKESCWNFAIRSSLAQLLLMLSGWQSPKDERQVEGSWQIIPFNMKQTGVDGLKGYYGNLILPFHRVEETKSWWIKLIEFFFKTVLELNNGSPEIHINISVGKRWEWVIVGRKGLIPKPTEFQHLVQTCIAGLHNVHQVCWQDDATSCLYIGSIWKRKLRKHKKSVELSAAQMSPNQTCKCSDTCSPEKHVPASCSLTRHQASQQRAEAFKILKMFHYQNTSNV